jgi:hypothetical protein
VALAASASSVAASWSASVEALPSALVLLPTASPFNLGFLDVLWHLVTG